MTQPYYAVPTPGLPGHFDLRQTRYRGRTPPPLNDLMMTGFTPDDLRAACARFGFDADLSALSAAPGTGGAPAVDVLAVMDAAEVRCGPELAAAMAEARAAVADLITVADRALQRELRQQPVDAGNDPLVRELRAALARVGGGA